MCIGKPLLPLVKRTTKLVIFRLEVDHSFSNFKFQTPIMRKVTAFLALFLGMALFVQAQTKTGKINGTILDGSQKNIQSATIALGRWR